VQTSGDNRLSDTAPRCAVAVDDWMATVMEWDAGGGIRAGAARCWPHRLRRDHHTSLRRAPRRACAQCVRTDHVGVSQTEYVLGASDGLGLVRAGGFRAHQDYPERGRDV